ncbi:MAG: hypothetical protein IKU34_05300 [Clostridia bacterium]|nr:hypothetical protein [Clostridia bacterium]
MKPRLISVFILVLMLFFASGACAEFDAQVVQQWLVSFTAETAQLNTRNDVSTTSDPARPGQYLLEYDFGTVLGTKTGQLLSDDILCVELTMPGREDCLGLQVGQTLEDIIGGREINAGNLPLYVLSTQESGYGWNWAYAANGSVYGVEYITYGGEPSLKEYTLTYVIAEGRITAIRLKVADATQAQAIEGQQTAEEIAQKQRGELLVAQNDQLELRKEDLTLNGRPVVGIPVEELIALLGEPQEIQVLPDGEGRMLVYGFCVAELMFDEMTGVELVRSLICVEPSVIGPRGVRVGMDAQEASGLLRCDNDVFSSGGMLYLAGEAQGLAPYGELIPGDAGQYVLKYTCRMSDDRIGMMNIGVTDGEVRHWRLSLNEEEEFAYGG